MVRNVYLTMRTQILSFAITLIATAAYADSGQPAVTPLVGGVLMRDGVVYPSYSTIGAGLTYDGVKKAFVTPATDPVFVPTFDIHSQSAIDDAIAGLATQRTSPTDYANTIASLNAAAALGGSNATAIKTSIGNELAAAITGNNVTALAAADWSQADLAAALADNSYLLSRQDLSMLKGLTTASLAGVDPDYGLCGTIFPAMNLTGFAPTSDMIAGADLSLCTGLTVASFAAVSNNFGLSGTILPAMDLTGFAPTGYMIQGADFSRCTGLTVASLGGVNPSSGLASTILPAMDLTGFAPTSAMIQNADLSRCTGLTAASFKNVGNLNLTTLPKGITAAQLTAAGLTAAQMNGAIYTP